MKYRILESNGKFYAQKRFLWFWVSVHTYSDGEAQSFSSFTEAESWIDERIKIKFSVDKIHTRPKWEV